MQIFNILIPLITYPYLIKVLGKEVYGLVVFVQAIVAYLVIIVGFGFNISATRQVSIHRDNKEKLDEIVSSVLIIKGYLFLICCIIIGFLIVFIPKAYGYEALFLLSMWACLHDLVFPIWYFSGVEQMKYITYITLLSRLVFLGLIFVFIHSSADYLYVPIIYGIGAFAAGSVALIMIFGNHKIKFKWQPIQNLKYYFKDSIPIFICNVSTVLYVSTNKVIVGTFLGMTEVAYYDLAEKITSILKIPLNTLSQSLFPKISKDKNINFVKKVFWISLLFNILLYILTLLFSQYVILILGGQQMLPAKLIVNILALTVPIVSISGILGVQLLIPFGYNIDVTRVVVISGMFYLLLILFLLFLGFFSIINISIIAVLTEVFVSIYMFYYCNKHKLWNK